MVPALLLTSRGCGAPWLSVVFVLSDRIIVDIASLDSLRVVILPRLHRSAEVLTAILIDARPVILVNLDVDIHARPIAVVTRYLTERIGTRK